MNPLRFLPLFCVILAFTLLPTAAQDEAVALSWTIEQTTIPDPVKPPEGWTYPGTILVNCDYGICGLRSDWEQRHVLNFIYGLDRDLILYQGTLSPDMHWYAAARGEYWCNGSCTGSWRDIYSIAVFDLSGDSPRRSYVIRWPLGYPKLIYEYDDAPPLVWLDNEHLVYSRGTDFEPSDVVSKVLNPFTEVVTKWTGDDAHCIRCSPDRTRNLDYNRRIDQNMLIDRDTKAIIRLIDDAFLPAWVVSWSPDSQFFLAVSFNQEYMADLKLYSRDGNVVTSILQMDSPRLDYPQDGFDFAWSPDGQQFWMAVETGSEAYHHYLVNISERHIMDITKIYTGYVSGVFTGGWSPDSHYLTLWDSGSSPDVRNVVLDISTMQAYTLDSSDGNVLGWRGDE